jgi:hypothetical protein
LQKRWRWRLAGSCIEVVDPRSSLYGKSSAHAVELLRVFPFSYRKAVGGAGTPFLREMIIPFGSSGYVALFEIEDPQTVTILAVRHQREEDYH